MNEILHVPPEQLFVVSERERSGRNRVMRSEQMSVAWMQDILSMVSKAEQEEVDPCAGTSATVKKYMILPPHCEFVGCEIDTDCYNQTSISLLGTISTQVLNENWDITGSNEIREAAKLFVNPMDEVTGTMGKIV